MRMWLSSSVMAHRVSVSMKPDWDIWELAAGMHQHQVTTHAAACHAGKNTALSDESDAAVYLNGALVLPHRRSTAAAARAVAAWRAAAASGAAAR